MKTAHLTIEPAFTVAKVDRRLFGSFVEHMGRCVYGGIYEPGHPRADADGFRADVLDLVREMGVSLVRYPGGNFVSGYNWEDGVGPREDRPTRLDLAWRSIESNEFGLNEFASWARRADLETMLAVNLGTRGVDAARNLLEYCNHPAGTYWSDLRISHGAKEPHGIKRWCLGNEMDGTWQIGHKPADEYGRLAAETAKAMRLTDPSIELVACGSSSSSMPTFGEWEAQVLDHTYEYVDYISLHAYYERVDDDLDSFLASAVEMDRFIEAVAATCDHVAAKKRSSKKLRLSFDEWNVWYMTAYHNQEAYDWQRAPRLIEDTYNVADAVVVGSLLISLLKHADRVGIACQAQLVNVIGPIRAEPGGPSWRQTIFHPFAATARHARGTLLRTEPSSPLYATAKYGDVALVDAVATHDEETGEVALFAVNRDSAQAVELSVNLRSLPKLRVTEFSTLTGDAATTNTQEHPYRVQPVTSSDVAIHDGVLTAKLPALSWNVLRLGSEPSTASRNTA